MIAGVLAGCGTGPVAECDVTAVDCCIEDRDCRQFYGREFPFCLLPGSETGVCAECRVDEHCSGENDVCVADAVAGALCCDTSRYYCAP